ncbi:hypothetical protein GGI19_006674, partial [Coemansia pectinata]
MKVFELTSADIAGEDDIHRHMQTSDNAHINFVPMLIGIAHEAFDEAFDDIKIMA